MLDRPVYHQSELQAFLKCGKLWEFRYVRGVKLAPRAALTVGSAVDQAVSLNLSQKIQSGEDLPAERVDEIFSDDFDVRARETEWQDEDPGRQKDVGIRLVRAHHAQVAPKIVPESVQEKFLIETDAGYDLGGTIDFTEKSGVIGDTKTSRTAYAPDAPKKALQPALYDFAYEALRRKKSTGFRYDVLIKPSSRVSQRAGSEARVQEVRAELDQDDRRWLFETVGQVHKAIRAGVALPAPEGSWYCTKQWCGYWDRCKGSGSR